LDVPFLVQIVTPATLLDAKGFIAVNALKSHTISVVCAIDQWIMVIFPTLLK